MTNKQRTWGQFATPTDVADLLLGLCLRRPNDQLLDPSCGDGALLGRAARWRAWLASAAGDDSPESIHGIELDPHAAAVAETIAGVTIERANFFTLDPRDYRPFDVIVGNPPYTRAEWIDRLGDDARQLALFPDSAPDAPPAPHLLLPGELRGVLGGRAGLYAYFFLHGHDFLREGGRLGFIVPNGWLDVAYGEALKQFLLDHFRIVMVLESAVERWFATAGVNTCLVILERAGDASDRTGNRVRFVRLRQPLRDLLGHEADSRRVSAVESLVTRLLPATDRHSEGASVRVRSQGSLTAGERWGAMLRAPDIYLRHPSRPVVPLANWATIQRGHTTGANNFFYLDRRRVEQWGIEPAFRRPLLKSLRGVRELRISAEDCRHELLVIPPHAELAGTAVADYLAWGETQEINSRTTCAGRRPWYALADQAPGDLLLAKGIWQRHFAAVPGGPVAVDQQIYRVILADGVAPGVAGALLNSAWFALTCELGGRVNLGEGVLWLASYELDGMMLPDPRALNATESRDLEENFRRVAERPIADTTEMLEWAERRRLDDRVFDLLGLSVDDRETVRTALLDCLEGRRRRARRTGEKDG